MVSKKGFTLIEILVVIGILAIIVVVGSTSFFNLIKGSTKAKTASLIKQNGDYALEVMTRMIRNARRIDSDCLEGMSDITVMNPDNYPTIFSCAGNSISSNSAELISNQINVESCSFNCQEGSYFNPDTVTINFVLSTGNPARPEAYTQVSFGTTVTLRNIAED